MKNKISILAENYAHKVRSSEKGFSVFIEFNGYRILFDVGYSGVCALNNARELGILLSNMNAIVLSHGHYDHTDGLESILKQSGPVPIYAHSQIFSERYSLRKKHLEFSGIKLDRRYLETALGSSFILHDKMTEIFPSIFMSGEVPQVNDMETISPHFKRRENGTVVDDTFPDDNTLILDTPKGLLLILGCAHRGLVNIIMHAKKELGKKIYGVIGGTHLQDVSKDHFDFVVNFLRQENVELIAPSHCTGIEKIFELKNIFKERVTPAFCGEEFHF